MTASTIVADAVLTTTAIQAKTVVGEGVQELESIDSTIPNVEWSVLPKLLITSVILNIAVTTFDVGTT